MLRSRRIGAMGIVLACVVGLAACGSSSKAPKANSAVSSELSYFPAGSPFVLTFQTDPNSEAIRQAHALEDQFPLAAVGQAYLASKLSQLGINYSSDIRPLFGNPVAVGVDATSLSGQIARTSILIAWVTKDAGKLRALLGKLQGLPKLGTRDGATLYGSSGFGLAVDGATLLFSPTPSIISDALDRHAHGGGIGAAELSQETAGLPSSSLMEIFGNLSQVLATPSLAKARLVPWVAALRGYGVALTASASGIAMRFHLDTGGRTLTASQLPLAAGSSTSTLAGNAPISVGVHDPAQIVSFVEATAQETGDTGYLGFLGRQARLRAKTGVDINSLAQLLTGDLLLTSDTHTTIGRATVSNPTAAAQDLAKLASAPRLLFKPPTTLRKLPGGIYAIVGPHRTIDVGVIGDQLVAGNASPSELKAFGATPAAPAAGAQGTLAFRVGLQQLLRARLKRTLPQVAQMILSKLGDITGSDAASPTGVDGTATIAIK